VLYEENNQPGMTGPVIGTDLIQNEFDLHLPPEAIATEALATLNQGPLYTQRTSTQPPPKKKRASAKLPTKTKLPTKKPAKKPKSVAKLPKKKTTAPPCTAVRVSQCVVAKVDNKNQDSAVI
jgi:hypothetical protein